MFSPTRSTDFTLLKNNTRKINYERPLHLNQLKGKTHVITWNYPILHRQQPITLVPYVRPSENERQQNLFKFLETYDDPRDFAKAFIVEEVKDTLDEDRHIYQNLDGVATFDSLNAEAKKSFALGHAYTPLNNFMDRPLEYLLESYDLHYINNWLTHVQIKE